MHSRKANAFHNFEEVEASNGAVRGRKWLLLAITLFEKHLALNSM